MKSAYQTPHSSRLEHVIFYDRRRPRRRTNYALNLLPPSLSTTIESAELDGVLNNQTFVRWLFAAAGLNAAHYRPETLHRRLPACLRELRVKDIAEARRLLEREPSKLPAAIGALVIGVTSFFRDTHVFDDLKNTVLPALPKGHGKRRIWSVGCSDGAELYSVAMLLAESGRLGDADLLGTDCRQPAITHAREGVYPASELRHVPAEWWDKYFVKDGTSLRVSDGLRSATHWRAADIMQVREPGTWDLILCRNMAMYFRSEIAGGLWGYFERVLRPGGFLVLGKAERPVGAKRLKPVLPCIYRRSS